MIRPNAKILLEVRGLRAKVGGVEILKGVDLTVRAGEVHAVMGRNGSGKSTFAKALVGHPAYEVTGGTASFDGRDIFGMAPEERARAGLFLGFQYPIEIPGVSNSGFLRLAYNTLQAARGLEDSYPRDLVVLDRNPLENIRHTNTVRYVMKNGRLYDGDTLAEIYPRQRPAPRFYWQEEQPIATQGAR